MIISMLNGVTRSIGPHRSVVDIHADAYINDSGRTVHRLDFSVYPINEEVSLKLGDVVQLITHLGEVSLKVQHITFRNSCLTFHCEERV